MFWCNRLILFYVYGVNETKVTVKIYLFRFKVSVSFASLTAQRVGVTCTCPTHLYVKGHIPYG